MKTSEITSETTQTTLESTQITLESTQITTETTKKMYSKKMLVEKREHGLSGKITLVNFLRGMIGPGCLSLPLAFKQAGLWTAFVLVFLFGFLNNYCMLKLVYCSQYLSKRSLDIIGNIIYTLILIIRKAAWKGQNLSYGDVAYEACANSFPALQKYKNLVRVIVNSFIVLLQMGICGVFYVFIAVHLKEIFDEEFFNWNFSEKTWMFLILIPLIALNYIRTLKIIAVFSMIGNVLMFLAFAFILQYLIRINDFKNKNLPWITDFDGIMGACGSILYSFEGQAMVLPLENKLKRPNQMGKILSIGMVMVSIVCAVSGFAGYASYGYEVKGSITLNLPQQFQFTMVKLMLVLVVYFSFVIQLYVIIEMLWPKLSIYFFDSIEKIFKKTAHKQEKNLCMSKTIILLFEYVFRSVLVILAMIMALAVPNLEQIIPLVGITVGMMLAFVFPACLDLMTFLPLCIEDAKNTGNKWNIYRCLIINSILIAIGIFGLVAGIKANITTMIESNEQYSSN